VSVESGGDLQCDDGNGSTIGGEGCLEYREPEFTISIDDTNSPVQEGNVLRVNATIANAGVDSDTQTIALDVDGTQEDSTSVTLDGDETTTKTLEWSTNSGDAGDYTATVSSGDDSATGNVEVAATLPPEFSTLTVTLTKVTGSGDVNKVEFEYSIDRGDATTSTTFELEKGGSIEDTTTETGDGKTWEWNHNKVSPPMTLRANISGSECYEIQIPGSASQGDTYDILADGSTC
jgi:hypothetical protein